ncbi:hypothetical protein HRbin36_02614 [bacterium HR36]|nr:hypothetical protein HRbin36_02614 [bacterium HR36]
MKQSVPDWIPGLVETADEAAKEEPSFTRVEVGEAILSFYAVGPDFERTKHAAERWLQRLKESLRDKRGFPRPEQGIYAEPKLEWLDWQLQASGTRLRWCGAFHLVLSAEDLAQGQGCVWQLDEYKRFARLWTSKVLEAFTFKPEEASGVIVDEKPFYWTLALDTDPRVEWTESHMRQYRKAFTALVRVRSEDTSIYTERAMEDILASNLAFTTEELQLLSRNTGLIYVAKSRFHQRNGFSYVRRALVNSNALVRAMRAAIILFRAELDGQLQSWLQQRLRSRRTKRLLQELVGYAQSASEILRQFDEWTFRMTHQIGHEQAVFQSLLKRYQIGELTQGLHQQLSELHSQISDLHNQIQSRRLSWLSLLVVFPAAYQALKLVQEIWPALQNLTSSWWK